MNEERNWLVTFPGVPAWSFRGEATGYRDLDVFLEAKLYFDRNGKGFGQAPSIYPVTVTQARYGGTYEGGGVGGLWLAFPLNPAALTREDSAWRDWDGSDIECAAWWDRAIAGSWPVGRGDSPSEAYDDLIRIVAAKAGVSPESLRAEAEWPGSE